MIGILFMAGAVARTIGPIIVSFTFEHYGPAITWILEIIVLIFIIVVWIIFFKWMKPFKDERPENPENNRRETSASISENYN